jgi:hypothetical protein
VKTARTHGTLTLHSDRQHTSGYLAVALFLIKRINDCFRNVQLLQGLINDMHVSVVWRSKFLPADPEALGPIPGVTNFFA